MPDHPPHIQVNITKKQSKHLLREHHASIIRWTSDWDRKEKNQFWYVIKDRFDGMDELSSNTRNQVRKRMKNFEIEKTSQRNIAEKAYEAHLSATRNYTKEYQISKKEFESLIMKRPKDHTDFWIARHKESGEIAAYAFNHIDKRAVTYMAMKFHPKYLKKYVSYILIYEMNKYYLYENDYLYVNDGARNILHKTNIQDFLIRKFKFRKAYSRLHIEYAQHLHLMIFILYPLKGLFKLLPGAIFNKISAILFQEEIKRKDA